MMKPEQEPPLDPSVSKLIADIEEMARQVSQTFTPDPEQIRIFNTAYSQSRKQARADVQSQCHRAAE